MCIIKLVKRNTQENAIAESPDVNQILYNAYFHFTTGGLPNITNITLTTFKQFKCL